MSDIKLFGIAGGVVAEVPSTSVALEKSLQTLLGRLSPSDHLIGLQARRA